MKKTIVWVCSVAILAGAGFAGAETAAPKAAPEDFAARKARILQHMDEREKKMAVKRQETRGCVQAAQSDSDLKACREKLKAEHKEKRAKFHEMKEQRKQQTQ